MRHLILAVALLLLLPIGQTLAADITVDADCSLANAIRSANGDELVEPMADCAHDHDEDEEAQAADGEIIELHRIMIDVSGTEDGTITLDETLSVRAHILIDGSGFSINGGGNQIFNVTFGSLTANDLNMSNGFSVENGGAIAVSGSTLTLNNSAVRDSGARGFGGGIYALDSDVTLTDSVVSGNATAASAEDYPAMEVEEEDDGETDTSQTVEADTEGEAQTANEEEVVLPDVEGTSGGGVYFAGDANSLVIDRSGVDSNSSTASGGGIYIASGSATISNSTISGNSATEDGGGIYNAGASILTHVTVVGNTAANGGGLVDNSLLQLYNSLLSDNAGGDCAGSLNANLGNLIHDSSCNHDGLTAEPMLLLLAGSPAYYLPQEGSPVIDAALAEYCSPLDQRGIDRAPESCDIGAAEYRDGIFNFQIQSALAALTPGEGGGSSASEEEEEEEAAATAMPSNCGDLPGHIIVTDYTSSVFCKTMDHVGIGNELLVNNGAIYAVDIFGWVAAPLTVCFQHDSGAIVLLDAANSPRNIVPLTTWTDSDKQCATVDRVGSAVLMPLTFFTSGVIPELVWDLAQCSVTTTDILNLREGPSTDTAILANVLNDVTLSADRRNIAFYRVNYYGIIGWLSKDYLSFSGRC